MDKVKRIEEYLFNFFSNRFDHIDAFYRSTHRDRHTGIYFLKEGPRIMDFIMGIHGNIEEHYFSQNLIPHRFTTPEALFRSLNLFKNLLNENQKYLDINYKGEETSYIIYETQRIKDELTEMIDYAKKLWDYEDSIVPYQELRYKLITRNVPDFINILKSILASVSYAITKKLEGYFHSNVHLILKLLGFEILSEEMTNLGRIDAVIRLSDTIYILEFKFNKEDDLSKEALQQIKDKKYPEKFLYEKKDIVAIGVSFGERARNINGFIYEVIKT